MHTLVLLRGRWWQAHLAQPLNIAIALDFGGTQPNAFHLPEARAEVVRAPGFVGDVREQGAANCTSVALNPHGNGTHTECLGHITRERIAIHEALQDALVPALLVSVHPEPLAASGESYGSERAVAEDRVLSARSLSSALGPWQEHAARARALILRTLPNGPDKGRACYSGQNPPYFTEEAMALLDALDTSHLVVDLPSIDREEDGGLLPNHHHFWQVAPDGTLPVARWQDHAPSARTITEMAWIPDEVPDGLYLLNLQVAPFVLDAAPSRPVLFALAPIEAPG